MQQSDPDDRLLAALRGERVIGEDPAEATELRVATRIGAAARRARDEAERRLADDPPATLEPTATAPADDGGMEAEVAGDREVVPLRRRRRVSTWLPSAAAAVIAVIAGSVLYFSGDSSERIALLDLDPLTEQGAATAELLRDGGRYELRVAIEGIAPDGGYLELWLIDDEITQLVSFGPVEDNGTYVLPDGLDPAAFPVVDVSLEALDGDPTHSGQSVFRGEFSL